MFNNERRKRSTRLKALFFAIVLAVSTITPFRTAQKQDSSEMGSGLRSSLYGWIDNMVYDAYAGGSGYVDVEFDPRRGGSIVSGVYEYTTYAEGVNSLDFEDSSSYSLPYASKRGYHFDGWYGLDSEPAENAPHPNVTPYPMAISGSAIEESQTLYAFYTPLTYEISYEDSANYTLPSTMPESYTYGEETAIGDASKEGMKFLGWSTDPSGKDKFNGKIRANTIGSPESQNNPSDNGACTLRLYAFFTPLDYSITYEPNGVTEASDSKLPDRYTYGTALQIPAATKTGYDFIGWSTNESGTPILTGNKILSTQTGNITLYAIFKAKTYTVTYEKNGGTEASDSKLPDKYTCGTALQIPAMTKTGYKFGGWS
nr:InlB B-repeat-containing protein [Lachnospiraceae bacterium]